MGHCPGSGAAPAVPGVRRAGGTMGAGVGCLTVHLSETGRRAGSMDNPYRAPVAVVDSLVPARGFTWKRALLWALAIYVAVSAVAFLAGLSMGFWEFYGTTLEEAIVNNR